VEVVNKLQTLAQITQTEEALVQHFVQLQQAVGLVPLVRQRVHLKVQVVQAVEEQKFQVIVETHLL
tara:strand:+ start:70 stop:267 length:198 start_codon:yes stop_codon:yes gene_type:complete